MRNWERGTYQALAGAAEQAGLVLADALVAGDVACEEVDGVHEARVWAFAGIGVLDAVEEASDVDVEVVPLALGEEYR